MNDCVNEKKRSIKKNKNNIIFTIFYTIFYLFGTFGIGLLPVTLDLFLISMTSLSLVTMSVVKIINNIIGTININRKLKNNDNVLYNNQLNKNKSNNLKNIMYVTLLNFLLLLREGRVVDIPVPLASNIMAFASLGAISLVAGSVVINSYNSFKSYIEIKKLESNYEEPKESQCIQNNNQSQYQEGFNTTTNINPIYYNNEQEKEKVRKFKL